MILEPVVIQTAEVLKGFKGDKFLKNEGLVGLSDFKYFI